MSIQTSISLILAPVVMISCTTLFLNGLFQRYDSLANRMRAMHIEQLDLLRILRNNAQKQAKDTDSCDEFNRERLREIELQLPKLLHRYRMMPNAMLASEISIGVLVLSMFVISAAVIAQILWLQGIAVLTLPFGAAIFLASVMVNAMESKNSPREINFEVLHSFSIGK